MLKSILTAFALAGGVVSAQAQTMCTYVDIARAQDSINKMRDASAKDEATREVALAQRSLAFQNQQACMSHMQRLGELSRQQNVGP